MLTGPRDPHVGTNERRLDMLEKRSRETVSDVAKRDARRVVAIWNVRRAKGRELWFHLRIGAAIAAGNPRLMFLCPAQQIGEIDLRKPERHPDANETIGRFIVDWIGDLEGTNRITISASSSATSRYSAP
jgi:hypothetical protein